MFCTSSCGRGLVISPRMQSPTICIKPVTGSISQAAAKSLNPGKSTICISTHEGDLSSMDVVLHIDVWLTVTMCSSSLLTMQGAPNRMFCANLRCLSQRFPSDDRLTITFHPRAGGRWVVHSAPLAFLLHADADGLLRDLRLGQRRKRLSQAAGQVPKLLAPYGCYEHG